MNPKALVVPGAVAPLRSNPNAEDPAGSEAEGAFIARFEDEEGVRALLLLWMGWECDDGAVLAVPFGAESAWFGMDGHAMFPLFTGCTACGG